MVFIPLITVFVYPKVVTLARPLVRLGTGLALSSVTFLIVAFLQYRLEGGASMSIAWQLIPYCVLTISEILLSTTGLEFAYTQAPLHLKSVITSFWNLTIFAGNMLVAAITFSCPTENPPTPSPRTASSCTPYSPPWWRWPIPSGRAGTERRSRGSIPDARE